MYWSSILIKKIYKSLRTQAHSFCLNEFLLQYTLFIGPVLSYCTYTGSTNPIFWLDIFGQSVLSVNSCFYHRTIYKKLQQHPEAKINILDDDIRRSYMADIFSIQLRVFSVIFVNTSHIENGMVYLALFASSQLYVLYIFYNYMQDKQGTIMYNEEKKIVDYLLLLPIVAVILVGVFHNNDRFATNHLLISSFFLFNCIVVRPFYELNHFFLHIGLLYQAYAISSINTSLLKGI